MCRNHQRKVDARPHRNYDRQTLIDAVEVVIQSIVSVYLAPLKKLLAGVLSAPSVIE